MSYSSSFALYHISKNAEKQEKIFTELSLLMSVDDPVTEDILNKSIYTKAAIKEVFRMNPISVGVGRILAKDAVLSHFHVPAGVNTKYDYHYSVLNDSRRRLIVRSIIPCSFCRRSL